MKFSIITPTFTRSTQLQRAVSSLQAQTYKDWEMIIVNDSPFDESYKNFASSINDQRIRYFVNDTNKGVNYSRNKALTNLSADSKWVILLDDDDYLAPDALSFFFHLIRSNSEKKWFVTNRALKNGESLTSFPKEELYSYAWSYLILKRVKGDATHCIETKLITQNKVRFSRYVKQGEEWFFFFQIGLFSKMYYSDHNSTISDGYNTASGLNFRKRTRSERFETISSLLYEGITLKKIHATSFLLYIFIRYCLIVLPHKKT